jgi:hypothetical protein
MNVFALLAGAAGLGAAALPPHSPLDFLLVATSLYMLYIGSFGDD